MEAERFVRRKEREVDELLYPLKPRGLLDECAQFIGMIANEAMDMATEFEEAIKFADGINLYWVADDRRGIKEYLKNYAKRVRLPQLSLYRLAKLFAMASKACKKNPELSHRLEQLAKQAMEDYARIRLEFTPQLLDEAVSTMDITRMVNAMEKVNETLQRWAENIYQLTTWALEEAEKTAKTRELAQKLTG